ncbi:MAG: GNAT family N-acetyltransferase [Luteimonas sp.]|nr:GNAT family N-acetyltransferase [Luteimonas sp.]
MSTAITVEPASAARWDDLQLVFGQRGQAAKCQCQRAILPLREYWHMPREMREAFLHKEVRGARGAAAPGLVAYLDGEPAGWCRLGPRSRFAPLRNSPVPWSGRDEDKADDGVWAVVCFVVRAGYRKRGISGALVRAAVEHARRHGAVALEGYPMATGDGDVPWGELHVGAVGTFRDAGFREVSRPTQRRHVMRIDFRAAADAMPHPSGR